MLFSSGAQYCDNMARRPESGDSSRRHVKSKTEENKSKGSLRGQVKKECSILGWYPMVLYFGFGGCVIRFEQS